MHRARLAQLVARRSHNSRSWVRSHIVQYIIAELAQLARLVLCNGGRGFEPLILQLEKKFLSH